VAAIGQVDLDFDFKTLLGDRMDADNLREIPYGIASLHGEAKKPIAKKPRWQWH